MKINVTKSLGRLKPVDEGDVNLLRSLSEGCIYSCKINKPRNIRFHRMFFGMINLCFENQGIFNNIDHFREEMLKASSHFITYKNHKGIDCYKAKSISFSRMNQDEFENVYESVFMTILQVFNWQESEKEFREELKEFKLKQ